MTSIASRSSASHSASAGSTPGELMRSASRSAPGNAADRGDGHASTRLVLVELNEAERHFLDALIAKGKLPTFARMVREGALVTTRIPTWQSKAPKAWRDISPWIVWPSLYTGLAPAEHGIVAFGQDTSSLRGRCIWDVLDANEISVGVCGSLMSFPPRSAGNAKFYVPESLAEEADCFPDEARAVQEFCVFTARNYSERFGPKALQGLRLLLRTRRSGVRPQTICRVLAQPAREVVGGSWSEPERAMLHSYIVFDAFKKLFRRYRPRFATVHMNHVAYMQHRFWRAAEPERFDGALSETDRRFFQNAAARDHYERKLSGWIEKSFVYADHVLAEMQRLAPSDTIFVVATGLGQRPLDPCKDIYNPVIRLVHEGELFSAIGLPPCRVLHQMNPDLTLNFGDDAAAESGVKLLEGVCVGTTPLFHVQRRGPQVFIEVELPRPGARGGDESVTHPAAPSFRAPIARFIQEHRTNDQSTAHHKDTGWLLAWSATKRMVANRRVIPVTDVAATVLSLFGIDRQPWMAADTSPAFGYTEHGAVSSSGGEECRMPLSG